MSGRYAYDLDGVLCTPPPTHAKAWRRMNGAERKAHQDTLARYYVEAQTLYVPHPKESFVVITARNAKYRRTTEAWLRSRYAERVVALAMLEGGRTIERVVAFKAQVLRQHQITDYFEDNRTVVRELRKVPLHCRIWHYKRGQFILDYEAPL